MFFTLACFYKSWFNCKSFQKPKNVMKQCHTQTQTQTHKGPRLCTLFCREFRREIYGDILQVGQEKHGTVVSALAGHARQWTCTKGRSHNHCVSTCSFPRHPFLDILGVCKGGVFFLPKCLRCQALYRSFCSHIILLEGMKVCSWLCACSWVLLSGGAVLPDEFP